MSKRKRQERDQRPKNVGLTSREARRAATDFGRDDREAESLALQILGVPAAPKRNQSSSGLTDFERDPYMCGTCRVPISRLTSPFGTREWVHDHFWQEYDHEVDPVPAAYQEMKLTCDFCGEGTPTVAFEGPHLQMRVGGQQKDYGTRWAACAPCDPLVRRKSVNKIIERHIKSSTSGGVLKVVERDLGRPLEPEEVQLVFERERPIIEQFVNGITRRTLLPPPRPPVQKILPARLARVRAKLARSWRGDTFRKTAMGNSVVMNFPGEDAGTEEFTVQIVKAGTIAGRFCDRMAFATDVAELFWISAAFTKLAIDAGRKLPDLTITREEVPCPSGLMVFAEPVHQVTQTKGAATGALIVAASWTLVPGGVWVVAYAQPEQVMAEHDPEFVRETLGFLLPISSGAGMPFGVDPGIDPSISQENNAYSLWGTLFAAWMLLDTPGVARETREKPEKSFAKSYARANPNRPLPDVRIVDIRRAPPRKRTEGPADEADEGTKRVITKRSLVGWATGGFPRYYWHGPGKTLRKRRWVKPFPRGPEDAPFSHEVNPYEVVKVLR